MKKLNPQQQSPLDRLPLHQKQQLAAWLTTGGKWGSGLPYREVRSKLFSEYGVKTSQAAICGFFRRFARPAPIAVETTDSPDRRATVITITIQHPHA